MSIWQKKYGKIYHGYEGLYQVSNLGKIKSLDRYKLIKSKIKGRVLKPGVNNQGYYQISLNKDGKTKHVRINRIVAEVFIKNNENKQEVNHKDGNKQNNCVNNLEWVTPKENIQHAVKNNLINPVKGKKHYKSKKIRQYTKDNKFIKEYFSITEASKQTKILRSAISMCLTKKNKTAGGFIWRYDYEK